jgi:hypothetical protein
MGHSIEVGPLGLTDQDGTCRPQCRATAWGATSPVPPAVPSGAMGGTVALSVQTFAFPHSGRCGPSPGVPPSESRWDLRGAAAVVGSDCGVLYTAPVSQPAMPVVPVAHGERNIIVRHTVAIHNRTTALVMKSVTCTSTASPECTTPISPSSSASASPPGSHRMLVGRSRLQHRRRRLRGPLLRRRAGGRRAGDDDRPQQGRPRRHRHRPPTRRTVMRPHGHRLRGHVEHAREPGGRARTPGPMVSARPYGGDHRRSGPSGPTAGGRSRALRTAASIAAVSNGFSR